MTINEAAAFLRISRADIYRLFNAGMLPYFVIGGRRRIRHADIALLIDAGMR